MARIHHRLEHCQILLDDYLHPLFGAPADANNPLRAIQNSLGSGLEEGYDSNGHSFLAQRLRTQYKGPLVSLEAYDENIKRHLDRINARRPQDEQIVLKYFQQLALLYTEHVLDRIYSDVDTFVTELNQLVDARNQKERNERQHFDPFTADDLTKLAYWMATGSGKTLLLHFNYLQIQHYMQRSKAIPFENILLITPNAGLSQQHLQELQQSGIPAQLYRQGGSLSTTDTIQIIEITKFTEAGSGPQLVNVGHFEGRNLVFVDEGHRGASGDVWIKYRDKLANDGFTFEYSATFGEAFNSGTTASNLQTRHSYGKSIVFDYSYRYFHGDGYGKDYTIVNLPATYHQDNTNEKDTLLLANLLTLYEQTYIYTQHPQELAPYYIERPLLMFVGRTVQTGQTPSKLNTGDKQSLSDVLDMVRFLYRVSSDPAWATSAIDKILSGNAGLKNADGVDIFAQKYQVLRTISAPATIYQDLLSLVFHAQTSAPIHLANLQDAAGEISLRVGSSDTPFGVINIGDDSNFITMAEEENLGLVIDTEDLFRGSLFSTINHSDSNINILVGAKKFTEGWSSWRVSGMGLLNVGRSEGSEVIQMFGRGVRLKGYERSLKRSSQMDGSHPDYLPMLEMLNIFSVNGDYLAEFRNALDREGIIDGYEEIQLPVRFSRMDAETPQLYVIRPKRDAQFINQPAFALRADPNPRIRPIIDMRPRLQVLSSQNATPAAQTDDVETAVSESYLALLDWDAIYLEMLNWKRQSNFLNLVIPRQALQDIMTPTVANGHAQSEYYTLYAPQGLIAPQAFSEIPRLQAVVISILKQYAQRYYFYHEQEWESHNLEYRILDKDDPNLKLTTISLAESTPGYIIKVNRNRPDLIKDIDEMIARGDELYKQDLNNFPNIVFDRHLYEPLIAQGFYNGQSFREEPDIKSVPVGLNRGEARFVWSLRQYLHQHGSQVLQNKKLYLLRNLSRGKGIGFFRANNFYPDFILWLLDGNKQSIVFVDPKGLFMLQPSDFRNEKIQLYNTLRAEIQPRFANSNVTLDSYIISDKSYAETRGSFGDPQNPYSRQQFSDNHVLFPDRAAEELLQNITA